MASIIEQRLKRKQYRYSIHNVIFPDAGHWLVQFQNNYQVLSSTFFRVVGLTINGKPYKFDNGGCAWATMIARRKARAETLIFLQPFK